jgi:hypothetical protein
VRKRFALWLCSELYSSHSNLIKAVEENGKFISANDAALVELSSQLNDLRNKLAELQSPVEPQPQFHSGRAIPRSMRAERPRTGATQ